MTEQPDQPQAYSVRIDAPTGHANITLDGHLLPAGSVTAYSLHHSVIDGLPLLVLHTRQTDGAAFQGLARVAVGVERSPADIVLEFLAQIDPVLLDQEALNRSDYGGGPGATARAMISTLADWVSRNKDGA